MNVSYLFLRLYKWKILVDALQLNGHFLFEKWKQAKEYEFRIRLSHHSTQKKICHQVPKVLTVNLDKRL